MTVFLSTLHCNEWFSFNHLQLKDEGNSSQIKKSSFKAKSALLIAAFHSIQLSIYILNSVSYFPLVMY